MNCNTIYIKFCSVFVIHVLKIIPENTINKQLKNNKNGLLIMASKESTQNCIQFDRKKNR